VIQNYPTWVQDATARLCALRSDQDGWGYRRAGSEYAEPTALATMALVAVRDATVPNASTTIVAKGAAYLAGLQQPDGAVGINRAILKPKWPTALASLVWQPLSEYRSNARLALGWLLKRQGNVFPRTADSVLGHDTNIPGWPWVEGTHPWLEPSALAMLAICRHGMAGHKRVRDGVRMIHDRAIPSGGWNMGNKTVFGRGLRPQISSTGLALLALRAAGTGHSQTITRALKYLQRALPTTRSPESLAWGLLGLNAWNERPAAESRWLAESYQKWQTSSDSPMRLALLLLAVGAGALAQFGIQAVPTDDTIVGNLEA